MGTRKQKERQADLWIAAQEIAETPGHVFYERLDELLRVHRTDERVEKLCRRYYRGPYGRPSLAPSVYVRLMLIGYFEGIDSERGIAWRVADSLSLRRFIGYGLDEKTPDHSTISRTRRLYWVSTHRAVFRWILKILVEEGLLRGKTVSVDATTLEANAALRSIVRRDTGQSYEDYVKDLARAEGLEEPTREQLARFDRKRKKKGSNQEWVNPHDADARITKMKDGRTHLAHKAEHAVDLESGALVGLTLQPADRGDTSTLPSTLAEAQKGLKAVGLPGVSELVADKGYHSGEMLEQLHQEEQVRTYIAEPDRGRRNWQGKKGQQQAVYANRGRLRGDRSKQLHRKRAELSERSNAHMYETGGMRRLHLRGRANILKRLLLQAAAFNLALVIRNHLGHGKPRQNAGTFLRLVTTIIALGGLARTRLALVTRYGQRFSSYRPSAVGSADVRVHTLKNGASATGS
ncbi:MAG: transposase [Longimicrobiales bacterium]